MADMFHHNVAKLLFLCKRAQPDIQTSVAFLCTRVKERRETIIGKQRSGLPRVSTVAGCHIMRKRFRLNNHQDQEHVTQFQKWRNRLFWSDLSSLFFVDQEPEN